MGFIGDMFGATSKFKAGTPGVDDQFGNNYNQAYANNPDLLRRREQLLDQLGNSAAGRGPNPAAQMFQNESQQNMAQQMAMANSGRGPNAGLAARNAMANASNFNNTASGQAAQAGMQQALASQAQLGGMLNQGIGMNNQMMGGQLAANTEAQKTNAGTAAGNASTTGGIVGGILGGIGDAFGLSDEREKKDIKSGNENISKFLDALKAHSYNYKDPSFGKGEQTSVMAQELEKTPVGKQMVEETPAGKMVDYGKGFGAILAAQAQLNERLKALEGKKGKKNG